MLATLNACLFANSRYNTIQSLHRTLEHTHTHSQTHEHTRRHTNTVVKRAGVKNNNKSNCVLQYNTFMSVTAVGP